MNKKVWILAAALAMPALQGCFPLLATGMVAGALSVTDRRTTGAQVDDQAIELRGANRLREKFGDQNLASLVSYNRRVLIVGQAANQELKSQIEETVRGLPNVRDVVNELEVAGGASFGTHSNDTLITTKIKASLVNQTEVPANAIKVVTESGTVYLMGIVSEREGAAAATLAAGVEGVSKVVKVFEYISEDEVKRLNTTPAAASSGQQRP